PAQEAHLLGERLGGGAIALERGWTVRSDAVIHQDRQSLAGLTRLGLGAPHFGAAPHNMPGKGRLRWWTELCRLDARLGRDLAVAQPPPQVDAIEFGLQRALQRKAGRSGQVVGELLGAETVAPVEAGAPRIG